MSDGSRFKNVEGADNLYFCFKEYLEENGEIVGVKLRVDYSHGYGFYNGKGIVELKPGNVFKFTYEGTSTDDDGCPEDFLSIMY